MLKADLLKGWRAIAARLTERAPFDVSVDCAMRWARRANDPLPVRRWGKGRYAEGAALDAWCDRQMESPPSARSE